MTAQESHQRILERLDVDLSGIGGGKPGGYREHLARVLDRLDQVTTREDAEALLAEIGQEQGNPNLPAVCPPSVWLRAVECA